MQPNYKEEPLKEEINDPAGNSTKLTNRNKQVKKLARNLQMIGTDPFFNDYYAGQQEKAKQIELEQNVLGHIEKTVNAVSDIFKDETTGENLERKLATHNVGDTFLPDAEEQSTQSVEKMKQFMEDLKSSLPKRIHDEGQSRFLSERAKDFVEQSKSKFLQLYGKSPEQIVTENGDKENNNIEFLEAQSILHLEKFSNDLNKPNDDFYWDKIDWSKSIFDQNKDAVKGLISDLYRSITSSFGMKSTDIPITSEGEQNIWNKIYKSSYDKLPENSFIKQSLPSKDFQGILNFSLMDKLPKGDRPFAIDAMNGIVGSLAALPFYMWGLENLGLIKAGETGLKHLGGKEFTKRLLMSPVYTQPSQMGNQITENITNAKTVGDIFLGIGKPYLNALAEVTGETMTPILGLGLGKLKLWNKLSDGVEKSLQQLTGKFNTNLKTTTDWLMISPVTEAFEEEISNFINVEPSIFSGDFNLKRLSLEAISALGMGVPIGIVSQITRNKIESEIKNSDGFKQYLDEETLREENPTVDDYFEWLNQKQIKQEKTVQDAVSKTYETETTKQYKTLDEITNGVVQFGIQKSEQSKELQQELLDRIKMPTEEDLDLIKPNTILQTIRNTFGTQSQPEEVTLPMVSNSVPENISSNSKGLLGALTNPTVLSKQKGNIQNDYPVNFKGQTFADSEAAYQKFKTGNTEEDYKLMVDVITAKLQQHPRLVEETKKKGGLDWINSTRHSISESYDKKSRWTGVGQKSLFIKALAEAYQNVTSPEAQDDVNWNNLPDDELERQYQEHTLSNRGRVQIKFEDNVNSDERITDKELKLWGDGYNFDPEENMLDEGVTEERKTELRQIIKENKIKALNEFGIKPNTDWKQYQQDKNAVSNNLQNQQTEVQQINVDETVSHTFKQQEQSPNIEQLDKESQLENTSGLNYKQSSDGLLDMLRKQNLDLKAHNIDTPEKFFNWVQSFKTGNHTYDWLKFQVAWMEKFGYALDKQTKLQSNRTLLQEVFVSFYHSSKKPAVKLTIKNNTVKVEQYTGNSYVDADGIQKSLFGQEELWEKVQDILPEGSTVYRINQVQFGKIYNSFLDINTKDQPLDVVIIRNELLKQGYYWTGILPNSNTSLLIDIQNLIPDSPNKNNIDKWYAELDMFVGQALLNITDPLIKTKRIKATTGESPSAFIFPDLQDKLSKLTPASNVYYTQVDGKDQINYKYVVLDDSTVPQEFLSSLGDGEEYITPFLAEVIWDANGTPYIKRGAIKPKYFDLGVFWKWARKIRPPKSKMDYFMQKNGIASIVFSSTIKVGKPENMITWEQLNTQQTISKNLIMEHNILEDSNLMDKGKISKKAAGIGPNIVTTGIMHFLSRQGQNDVKQWLNQDFIELQNEFAKYIQDPYALEKEILSYVNDMDFSDDVTELIKSLENYPYAMRLPVVMDFMMKGNFKEKMFDAARHFKKGSSPAYVLDLGPLSNYKALENADPEAFDDKGYLKPGYIIIDAFTAKKFKYSVGDKVFTALNPPGAFVDLRAEKIAAILPEKMGANQLVGSILSYQDASGKDGDIDTINLIYVGTELDKKVWQHIKSANLEERYKEMMEKFKDKNTAKNILMFLNKDNPDYKPSEKEIQTWEKIAPLVRMEDNNDGVFALNTDFSKLTFENPDHWEGVQILSKEGLIGQLYNWKAIYTLFLENDYNLNGITANPDTNFTLPMLKQLTDMALDWTNTLDIAKIKFNWQDLVGKLFSFSKQYDKNVFTGFEKALKPIKDALVLTKQKDRGGDKFDYISYHEAISKAKQQLAKLPSGLEGSLLSMTIDGLEQIHLPKLAMTLPQINNVYNKLVYTMLGVPEAAVESNTKMKATKLANTGLGTSLDVIKALSRLGTHANNVNDELLNIRLLRSKSEDNLKAGRTNPLALSHPVTSVFNDWLNKVMETPTTKPDSLGKSVTIGQTRKNGYRYKFTNIDGELQYSIISVADNNVINTETFTDWKTFREKGGTDLNNWLVSEEIINLFKDIVQTSGNKVVKSVSDDLLKEIFPKIIDRESFQKADKNTKESFYYAVLGIVKANDWGLQVTDRPGVRNPLDANRFIKPDRNKKESIVSFAKPIAFLENFAYKDDVAIEVLVKFKRTVNALIEQELHKEQENTKPMYSLIFPVLPPALETKRVTLKDVMKLIPSNLTTEQEQQEWLDKTVRDNIATENDKRIFEKIVLKGLAEANKKYKFGWRAALMNPFVNAHTIPFDVFVDIFGKKDKLYTANQVVQKLPVDGRIVDTTANEVDVTFKHWSLGTKSKLISDAQIFWYVQHSLDRSYELARITQEQLIDSISKYVMASNQELDKTDRGKIVKEAKVYDSKFINVYLEKIWDKAEDITFRNSLVGFDLNQDVNAYYDFAMGKKVIKSLDANGKPTTKTIYEDTDIDSVKVKVGAMRYRYMFDVVVAKMLNDQLTNLKNIQDLALEDNNLNAYTTAQAFVEEIQTMQRQMEGINSTSAYMPHTWDSKEYWMEARIKIYEKAGVTKKEAEKKARKDWEDKENRTTIVGGLGNYVDVFFLTREANMDGYIKTPESAKRYFNQLNRLMRFQHLFAMEELMDNKISGEIPFMYKHAKEMAARVRGADKYGIKTSFENVKPNDLVLFNKTSKDDIQIVIGKVESVGNNKFTMADGLTVSKFQVTGLQKLWGNSVESRARIVFNKLGFDVNADREMLPVLAKYMLKLQASSMLTGSTFAVRNLLGGKLQELVFFGTDVMAKATNFVRTVGMDTLQKDTTDIQKEQFRLVYENSVALLGNIDEIMGKFGTIISALSEVNGIPNEHLDEMIRLKQDWDGTKTDLKALGIDPKLRYSKGQLNGNAIIRLKQFWTPFVKFMNFNFLANKKVEGVFGGSITNPGLGEKQLRFHTAIAAVEMHSGLDITNPQEKRLLVAFIDQAVRNTQFLYRVGLDQGMLESSPIARTLWSNYMHYPVSSFCTSFYYIDNWLKQRKEYKGRLVGLKDTEAFKKEYGTHSLPNQLIINENTPDEETIVFADTRYASVVRRMVQIKMLLEIMKTGSKMIKLRTFGVVSGVADVLLWLADLTSTSYALTGSSAISQLAMSLLSSLIPDDDEEDKLSKLKKVLYLTQEEYLADIQDKKWAEDVSDKVIKSVHTQNLIKGILDDVPVGVGASNIFDGLIASLVSGSLLPDNYQELGVSIANTYLPIRPLRNPLLGNIVGIFNPELGNNIKYPLNIGYNPLHTAKIKYEKERAKEKLEDEE